MKLEYKKAALKYMAVLDKPTRERIRASIDGLLKVPPEGDIKRLQGTKAVEFRLRVGKYRILFSCDDDILTVNAIDSRGDIYK